MKPPFALFALVSGLLAFTGCASAPPQDVTALVQAGFHTVQPETVSERDAYAALTPYTVQRTNAPGRPVYAYYDKGQKVTYLGEVSDYKRYMALSQQKVPNDHPEILTAQASVKTARNNAAN